MFLNNHIFFEQKKLPKNSTCLEIWMKLSWVETCKRFKWGSTWVKMWTNVFSQDTQHLYTMQWLVEGQKLQDYLSKCKSKSISYLKKMFQLIRGIKSYTIYAKSWDFPLLYQLRMISKCNFFHIFYTHCRIMNDSGTMTQLLRLSFSNLSQEWRKKLKLITIL